MRLFDDAITAGIEVAAYTLPLSVTTTVVRGGHVKEVDMLLAGFMTIVFYEGLV